VGALGRLLTRYDASLGARALLFTAVCVAVATAVVMLTDEPFSNAHMRVARLSAFAPALAAVGASVAIAQAQSRGELRALVALGAAPWRASRGAAVATWLVGAIAVGLLISSYADPAALFPIVTPASWQRAGAGLVETATGVYVSMSGELSFASLRASPMVEYQPSRWAAAMAIAPLAATVPSWIATPSRLGARALAASLSIVATVFLLHAVAAGQLGSSALLLTAAPILLHTVWARWRGPTR
jgi:hypothetical protein